MPISAILALVGLGTEIAKGLTTDQTAPKRNERGKLAAQGATRAADAIEKLKLWARTGYVPTNEELDQVFADSQKAHDDVQKA
jgi:hypothetical protein